MPGPRFIVRQFVTFGQSKPFVICFWVLLCVTAPPPSMYVCILFDEGFFHQVDVCHILRGDDCESRTL